MLNVDLLSSDKVLLGLVKEMRKDGMKGIASLSPFYADRCDELGMNEIANAIRQGPLTSFYPLPQVVRDLLAHTVVPSTHTVTRRPLVDTYDSLIAKITRITYDSRIDYIVTTLLHLVEWQPILEIDLEVPNAISTDEMKKILILEVELINRGVTLTNVNKHRSVWESQFIFVSDEARTVPYNIQESVSDWRLRQIPNIMIFEPRVIIKPNE